MNTEKKVTINELLTRRPEFTRNSSLDLFFEELERDFLSKFIKLDVNKIYSNYEELGYSSNKDFVTVALQYLNELRTLVSEREDELIRERNDLLPVSLHDIKYLNQLINLIIIHGIDANLPAISKIPLEQKRMNTFKETEIMYTIPKLHKIDKYTLELVARNMCTIVIKKSEGSDYVRSVILKGASYTNLFLAVASLYSTSNDINYLNMLENLEGVQETYVLFGMYTLLLQTLRDPLIRNICLSRLSTLAVRRDDGVISVVDFILGVREDEEISIEKLDRVGRILISKPNSMLANDYIRKLLDQIYDGLTYINRPVLITALNHLLARCKKIRWINETNESVIYRVQNIIFNENNQDHSAKELNDAINVLISLSKNPSREVVKDVTGMHANSQPQNFYLTLWMYSLFLKKNQKLNPIHDKDNKNDNPYYQVILSLLKSYISITEEYESLNDICLNLVNTEHEKWRYTIDLETQLACMKLKENKRIISEEISINLMLEGEKLAKVSEYFQNMDDAIDLFIELLKNINNDDVTTTIFLNTLNRWVKNTNSQDKTSKFEGDSNDSALVLLDLKLLEKINDNFKSDIIKRSADMLKIIDELMDFINVPNLKHEANSLEDSDDEDSNDEDVSQIELFSENDPSSSIFSILLELLSTVINNSSLKSILDERDTILRISRKLAKYNESNEQCSKLSRQITDVLENKKAQNNSQTEADMEQDYEKLDKAIVNLSDPLAPVKVYGLQQLRKLVEAQSSVISVKRVSDLYIKQLRNQDPYIFLNVIKGLSSLCQTYSNEVLPTLIEYYDNAKGRYKLDDVLKIGEVFINYIQKENELYEGKKADTIINSCLQKVREHENLDNRIRMSAMSILGISLQTNAKGIFSRFGDMLDCSFNILQLEKRKRNSIKNEEGTNDNRKPEDSFLMRRAAVHLINDLITNVDFSMLPEQYNYEKMKILVEYVKLNDDNYLVCEQATQLLEVMDEIFAQQLTLPTSTR